MDKSKKNIFTLDKKGTAYENPKQDVQWGENWYPKNIHEYKNRAYNKISQLLIRNFSKLEPYIEGGNLESLQKTYKDGKLVSGRNKSKDDMMVIYESDVEANSDDSKMEDALLNWLDFTDINQIDLKIITTKEINEDGKPNPPEIILQSPGKNDLNINELLGTMDLGDVNLKDNVSQFIKLDKVKTDINRTKLKEVVETEFSELTPETWTHLLEKYNRIKEQIPIYKYRSEGFWKEYIDSRSLIPIEYRVEKFFEEFERLKEQIPKGSLTPLNGISPHLDELSHEELYGFETLTYLVSETQNMIGSDNPIFSQQDAQSWWSKIDGLTVESGSLVVEVDMLKEQIRRLLEQLANATGSIDITVPGCTDPEAENYSADATTDDGTCEYVDVSGIDIYVKGTGENNSGPRQLKINEQSIYTEATGQGHKLSVFDQGDLIYHLKNPSVQIQPIYTKTFQTYENEVARKEMAETILKGPIPPEASQEWKFNDIFIITSYGRVQYDELLTYAIQTVGGCQPATVGGIEGAASDNSPTPYALIGSKGLGSCNGYESVGDDSPYTPPSEIRKFWDFDEKNEGGWEEPSDILGCTDPNAKNYNKDATADDDSCIYPPPPAYEENFNDWQDSYSPSSFWWRETLMNAIKTDGPKGAGDGAIRLYRAVPKGQWPGALFMRDNKNPVNEADFDIEGRIPELLYLQEGRTYKMTIWGRCATDDGKAFIFIGDTRGGAAAGYSWEERQSWNTNGNWTKTIFTFTPVKNKHYLNEPSFYGEYYHSPGAPKKPGPDIAFQEDSKVMTRRDNLIDFDWGNVGMGIPYEGYEEIFVSEGYMYGDDNVIDNDFQIRWTGKYFAPTNGMYEFEAETNEGCRLWIDDQIVIDKWVEGNKTYQGQIDLTSGLHTLKYEMYENAGGSKAKLYVTPPGGSKIFVQPASYGEGGAGEAQFPGVMGSIFLYPGTEWGAGSAQYCDYANIKIEELEEGETLVPAEEENECTANYECGEAQWCHSGWNGTYYGMRFCVNETVTPTYCEQNPCGIGDGDCDDDSQCGDGICGSNNCSFNTEPGFQFTNYDCCEEFTSVQMDVGYDCQDSFAANGPPEWGGNMDGGPCYGDGRWNRAWNYYGWRGWGSHKAYSKDDAVAAGLPAWNLPGNVAGFEQSWDLTHGGNQATEGTGNVWMYHDRTRYLDFDYDGGLCPPWGEGVLEDGGGATGYTNYQDLLHGDHWRWDRNMGWIRGYWIPEETGTYTFYVRHDDNWGISFDGGETWDNDWQTYGTLQQHSSHGAHHADWASGKCHAFQHDFIAGQKYPVLMGLYEGTGYCEAIIKYTTPSEGSLGLENSYWGPHGEVNPNTGQQEPRYGWLNVWNRTDGTAYNYHWTHSRAGCNEGLTNGHRMEAAIWSSTDLPADTTVSMVDNTGEGEVTFDQPFENQCEHHEQCGSGYYCHSGWDGTSFGPRQCVIYSNGYCKDNPCGPGDGDCDPEGQNSECDAPNTVCMHSNPNYGVQMDGISYGLAGVNGIGQDVDICVPVPGGGVGGSCSSHADCNIAMTGVDKLFCHSGWNGQYYGERHCFPHNDQNGLNFCQQDYNATYFSNNLSEFQYASPKNRCGVGDGDCDNNNQCADGLTCNDDLNNCKYGGTNGIGTGADCCSPAHDNNRSYQDHIDMFEEPTTGDNTNNNLLQPVYWWYDNTSCRNSFYSFSQSISSVYPYELKGVAFYAFKPITDSDGNDTCPNGPFWPNYKPKPVWTYRSSTACDNLYCMEGQVRPSGKICGEANTLGSTFIKKKIIYCAFDSQPVGSVPLHEWHRSGVNHHYTTDPAYSNPLYNKLGETGYVFDEQSYKTGGLIGRGPAASSKAINTGPSTMVNPDIKSQPRKPMGTKTTPVRTGPAASSKAISTGPSTMINSSNKLRPNVKRKSPQANKIQNCVHEKRMLQSLSGKSIHEIKSILHTYLQNNTPCINLKRMMQDGGSSSTGCPSICGDSNLDGTINVSDVVHIVNYILADGDVSITPEQFACSDLDNNGTLNIVDIVTLVEVIIGNISGNCNMSLNGGTDDSGCSGVIGCDGECYPSIAELPTYASFDACGDCGGGQYGFVQHGQCSLCCQQYDMGSCDSQQVCHQAQTTEVNEAGESYVVPGPLEANYCQYDWGDEICMYRRGGKVRGR